eukprot:1109846-Pleurochrysis_carterae.AAC.1
MLLFCVRRRGSARSKVATEAEIFDTRTYTARRTEGNNERYRRMKGVHAGTAKMMTSAVAPLNA